MKFSEKLVLYVTAIISVIFSGAGVFIVKQNFEHSLDEIVMQNSNQHILEKYIMESNIINNINSGEEITNKRIIEYANSLSTYVENKTKLLGIYSEEKEEIFSNLIEGLDLNNISQVVNENANNYIIREIDKKEYMIISSFLSINNKKIYIVSAYDITKVFKERDRQLNDFLILDVIVIGICTIFIFIFSIFLTKPIKKLNEISKKIATGHYKERVNIRSKDEIGELSNSFNLMATQIEDKIEKLDVSIKRKDDFIASFTHEIKTPMTVIIGFADLLKKEKCNKEDKKIAIDYIYCEAKRLEILSHKLMDLMSVTEENIEFEKINTLEFFQEIKQVEENAINGINIVLDIEDTNIKGDKILLDSMIRNLIENAKKAKPKDNQITVEGKKIASGKYRVAIIDRGSGIPQKDLNRITEDFYMVDKSRARTNGSNGIGLSICKKIAKLHDTDLCIESELGIGTKVYFEWEVIRDEQ